MKQRVNGDHTETRGVLGLGGGQGLGRGEGNPQEGVRGGRGRGIGSPCRRRDRIRLDIVMSVWSEQKRDGTHRPR